MNETLITSIISLAGIIVTAVATKSAFSHEIDKKVAVIETKMEQMTKQLEEHNHYAKLFSETVPVLQEKQSVSNKRISDLERITESMRKMP